LSLALPALLESENTFILQSEREREREREREKEKRDGRGKERWRHNDAPMRSSLPRRAV